MTLVEYCNDLTTATFTAFLFTFWPVLLFGAAVLLVQWIGRNWFTPRQRCWLWALVLMRMMLPYVPESSVSLQNLFAFDHPSSVETQSLDMSFQTAESVEEWSELGGVTGEIYSQPQSNPDSLWDRLSFIEVLLLEHIGLLWVTGTIAVLLWSFIVHWRFSQRLKLASTCVDDRLLSLLDECRLHMYVRKPVTILFVEELKHPALYGYFRPKILLPVDSQEMQGKQLRMVLLHELAHVQRRDILGNWWLLVVQAIHWWNPMYYVAATCFRRARELDCDTMVVEQIGRHQSRDYGELLLTYASQPLRWGHVVLPASLIGIFSGYFRKQALKSRLNALKNAGKSRHLVQTCVVFVVMLALVLTGMTNARVVVSDDAPSFHLSGATLHVQGVPPDHGPLLVIVYEIPKVLQAMEKQLGPKNADRVKDSLLQTVNLFISPAQYSESSQADSDVEADKFQCELMGTQLIVRATRAQHEELARMIPIWEEGNDVQHTIECRFITSKEDLTKVTGGAWQAMKSSLFTDQVKEISPENSNVPQFIASSATEEYMPVLFDVVDESQSLAVVVHAQSEAHCNIVFAPKVTLFNGQKATISDCTIRPFVTGVHPDSKGELVSDLSMVEDGLKLSVRATGDKNHSGIHVEGLVHLSEIKDVTMFNFKKNGKSCTVQLPTVQRRQIQLATTLKSDQSILIGCVIDTDKTEFLYLLLTVRSIHPQPEPVGQTLLD